MTGHAFEEIEKLSRVRRIDTALLFPNTSHGEKARPYEIRKSWNTALKEGEIDNFRFHDLRHSTASYLAMKGASLSEIAEVLGHKTLQMVKRYAQLSEAHTTKVVRALNDRLFGERHSKPRVSTYTAVQICGATSMIPAGVAHIPTQFANSGSN